MPNAWGSIWNSNTATTSKIPKVSSLNASAFLCRDFRIQFFYLFCRSFPRKHQSIGSCQFYIIILLSGQSVLSGGAARGALPKPDVTPLVPAPPPSPPAVIETPPKTAATPDDSSTTEKTTENVSSEASPESSPTADKLVLLEHEKLMASPPKKPQEDNEGSVIFHVEKVAPLLTIIILPIILVIELINSYSYICMLRNRPQLNTVCNCDGVKKGPTEVWKVNKRPCCIFICLYKFLHWSLLHTKITLFRAASGFIASSSCSSSSFAGSWCTFSGLLGRAPISRSFRGVRRCPTTTTC